jgi:hypothetical protein
MKHILTTLALFLTLTGCIKDEGRYDYDRINNALNTLSIQFIDPGTGDTLRDYAVEQGHDIYILPAIETSHGTFNESDYTYQWIAYNTAALLPTGYDLVNRLDSGDHARALNIPLRLFEGAYRLFYHVTEKATGIRYSQSVSMKVQEMGTSGWLVMCDDNDIMRIDMISHIAERREFLDNVLVRKFGPDRVGPPIAGPKKFMRLAHTDQKSPDNVGFYLMGRDLSYRIRFQTLEYNPNWSVRNHFMAPIADDFKMVNIEQDGQNNMMIGNDHNLYLQNAVQRVYFTVPINRLRGQVRTFRASPHFAGLNTQPYIFMVYDIDARSFYRIVTTNNNPVADRMPSNPEIRSFENTGLDLVDMRIGGFSPRMIYSVLKHPTTNVHHIMRVEYTQELRQVNFEEMLATDIQNAKFFATGGRFAQYYYYATNNKVYAYHISTKTTYTIKDFGHEEITMFKIYGDDLLIGHYDATTGYGSFGRYIPMEYGEEMQIRVTDEGEVLHYGPNGTPAAYFKKVVDAIWR